ncbi:hypothetical protein STEG23_002261, partial [Scotinomys teguina]
ALGYGEGQELSFQTVSKKPDTIGALSVLSFAAGDSHSPIDAESLIHFYTQLTLPSVTFGGPLLL